ncbi:hypothetical protein P691DRAFT_765920 [Macrolepiota fuliginosa MF-IS2]|uniref:Uncharacterized protein n=1 Tax=Macrolepiota fuliginosa MF-IS2 TaxID=1400762 RepID=A0A9P6BXR5_9AGAR|nr:hypothetical protein P691DRAFT_765920 [Macrolepiota fuliginosa MF-IS2]
MVTEYLPPETLAQIFKSKGTDLRGSVAEELKNYSLTCSRWRFPAQRELFSNFTITSLNCPRSPGSLPYSVIAKDRRYSHLGPAIRRLHIALLVSSEADPHFYLFLEQLAAVSTITFTHSSALMFFQREVFTPDMRAALKGLFRLPSFTTLVVASPGFPLALIPSCIHVRTLVMHSYTCGSQPNLDSWYHLRSDEDGLAEFSHIETIDLLGDSKYIDGFTTWFRDPKRGMSTRGIRHATIQFFLNRPAGPQTIFCNFGNVTHLTIRFVLKVHNPGKYDSFSPASCERSTKMYVAVAVPTPGDQIYLDFADPRPPTTDVKYLVNLRSLRFEIPETGQNRLLVDVRATITILHTWIMPFLYNLPSPSQLQNLELYLITPDDGRQPQPMSGTDFFARIWAGLDEYMDVYFLALKRLVLYTPWATEYGSMLPNCARRGVIGRVSYP